MGFTAALVLAALALDPAAAQERPGPIGRGDDAEVGALAGAPFPELPPMAWLDGRERTLATLRGRVVVIRSFTSGCPFCAATMPALEAVARDYGEAPVEVLAVYHPKPPRPVTAEETAEHARALGVTVPVGIDPNWALVSRAWLDGGRHWTSITWVLDREGVVRFVHPGGEYHRGGGDAHARCHDDERALRAAIDAALRIPAVP